MRMDGPGAETLPRSVLHKERTPGAGWTRIHPGSIDLKRPRHRPGFSLCATFTHLPTPARPPGPCPMSLPPAELSPTPAPSPAHPEPLLPHPHFFRIPRVG